MIKVQKISYKILMILYEIRVNIQYQMLQQFKDNNIQQSFDNLRDQIFGSLQELVNSANTEQVSQLTLDDILDQMDTLTLLLTDFMDFIEFDPNEIYQMNDLINHIKTLTE